MKIFIAATLKPVNDPRLYHKIALSLANDGNYEVCIAGYNNDFIPAATKKVKFYPLFKFARLSFKRVFGPWRILKQVINEKPDLLIIATHELLVLAFLLKMIKKQKVVYDIQENYFYNILYMDSFPVFLRPFLAYYVRLKELLIVPLLDGCLFAERIYKKQLGFALKNHIIIENKNQENIMETGHYPVLTSVQKHKFLYTGTVSEEYGIWEAVFFIEKLYLIDTAVQLEIIGYTPDTTLIRKLNDRIAGKNYIRADIRSVPVPYGEIRTLLSGAGILLLPYRPNKAIDGKIPTRFWEGLSWQLPMIIQENLGLGEFIHRYSCGLSIDFADFSPDEILHRLENTSFYTNKPGPEVYWSAESVRLIEWINKIISGHRAVI